MFISNHKKNMLFFFLFISCKSKTDNSCCVYKIKKNCLFQTSKITTSIFFLSFILSFFFLIKAFIQYPSNDDNCFEFDIHKNKPKKSIFYFDHVFSLIINLATFILSFFSLKKFKEENNRDKLTSFLCLSSMSIFLLTLFSSVLDLLQFNWYHPGYDRCEDFFSLVLTVAIFNIINDALAYFNSIIFFKLHNLI